MKWKIIYFFCSLVDFFIPRGKFFGTPVFLYHSISDTGSRLAISPSIFRQQMKYLNKLGYRTVAPLKLKEVESKKMVITFDDGFQDNFKIAEPIMREYGFAGTVFVSTDYIGKQSEYCRRNEDKKLRMMSVEELELLKGKEWTIANHFAGHVDLDGLSENEIKEEYTRAKNRLIEIIHDDESPRIVSYPHNRCTNKIKIILKKLGVKMAFAGERKPYQKGQDIYSIPRIEIDPSVNFDKFKLYLSPSFYFLRKIFRKA